MGFKPSIAVIGAGLSGLVAASSLREIADITVFEKARGVGGRMSTRRKEPYHFDHGAQYFTARDKHFQGFLKPFIADGIVQEWQPKVVTLGGDKPYKRDWFEPHYVCVPGMNALCKALAEGLDVRVQTEICALNRADSGWMLADKNEGLHGVFDYVVLSAPAPQAMVLLPDGFKDKDVIFNAQMQGCFSLMLSFDEPPLVNWDAAVVKDSGISWMAVNSAKPGRPQAASMVVHSSNDWAESHLEEDPESVREQLLEEFTRLTGISQKDAEVQLHRWRYAATSGSAGQAHFFDQGLNIAVCGDWCLEGRVESAFLSAYSLAKALQENIA